MGQASEVPVVGARAGGGAPDHGTIRVSDAVKQFEGGVLAVDHVSFEARPGEFISLVGSGPKAPGSSSLG